MQPRPERTRHNRRLAEITGLLSMFLAVLTLASLLSYRPQDATWFQHGNQNSPDRNWIGPAGANLAELLLQLFGTAAFLMPLLLVGVGYVWFRADLRLSAARLAAHALLVVSLCALLDLLFGDVAYRGEPSLAAGGYIGRRSAGALRALLNTPGALLFAATTLLAMLILTTRLSLARSFALALRGLAGGGGLAATGIRHGLDAGRTWLAGARKARAARPATPAPARSAEPEPVPRSSIRVPAGASAAALPEPPLELPAARAETEAAAAAPRKPRSKAPKQAALPMEPGQRDYRLPPLDLLAEPPPQTIESEQELLDRAQQITGKLQEFAVHGAVVAIHPGPVVTTFEFKPEPGVKYSKITGMVDDLSLALKAESVRIDRMAGRATVGIEVPNRRKETIYPKELLQSERFRNSRSKLTLALGKDISGAVFTTELDRMPHLLIAGATGSGKSVGLNSMIASILYKATPEEVRFVMIDTKMIELGMYAHIPHLLVPVVTEAKHAATALKWACREMEARYRKLASQGSRNITQFNEFLEQNPGRTMEDPKGGDPIPLSSLPYIVIVIDELADLMMVSSSEVEEAIMRLAQMARAVGIHLIIATQRPSVNVITGTIKANFPSRIAFRVSQRVDSRTIIDQQGAEHLLGHGDMLYLSGNSSRLKRVHGAYITEAELNRLTAFVKKTAEPVYDESVLKDAGEDGENGYETGERDDMYEKAVRTVIQEGKCSVTLIQRRLQLGYARAARIVDMMEHEGVVSAGEGSKPREILVGPDFVESFER